MVLNSSIIRKTFGYVHIPKGNVPLLNIFNHVLNYHINFHRHCGFATDVIGVKGKIVKVYDVYLTPMQKLLSLPLCEQYLKPGVTKDMLVKEALRMNHMESGKDVNKAKAKLFKEIFKKS